MVAPFFIAPERFAMKIKRPKTSLILFATIILAGFCTRSAQAQQPRPFICNKFEERDGRPGKDINNGEFIGLGKTQFSNHEKIKIGINLPLFQIKGKQTCIYIETPNNNPIHWHQTVSDNTIIYKDFTGSNLLRKYGAGRYTVRFAFDNARLGSKTFVLSNSIALAPSRLERKSPASERARFKAARLTFIRKLFPAYENLPDLGKSYSEQSQKQRLMKLLDNPRIAKQSPYYRQFEKELNEILNQPRKTKFSDDFFEFLATAIHNPAERRKAEQKFAEQTDRSVNLKNPTDAVKAFLFFSWILSHEIDKELDEEIKKALNKEFNFGDRSKFKNLETAPAPPAESKSDSRK